MRSAVAVDTDAAAPYATAGAAGLARQAFPTSARTTDPTWPPLYRHLESRITALRSWRYSWWQHWAIIAQYILPYRYHWVVTPNTYNRGYPVNDAIINETGTLAMQICAAGLLAGLMSPSRPWFALDAPPGFPVDEEIQIWLDDTTQRISMVLSGSNFYTQAAAMFQDVATFGTSSMIIYEDGEDVIRCYVPVAGEYFLGAGGRLSIDTHYREFTYTVLQNVDYFKLNNCPEVIRNLFYQGGGALEQEFVVAHAIEPNFGVMDPAGRRIPVVPQAFPYREVYWLRGQGANAEFSRRGFWERPFVAARWSATSNDPYGRGCGMTALGGVRQLQLEETRKGEYIDKAVRPPMGADVSLENKPSSILPGEITYVDATTGKPGFYPLFQINMQGMEPLTKDIERVEDRIKSCFFVPIFQMISQMEGIQPRNELEILERKGEKIQQLGPMIELFEAECASPMIQRVASIMARRGLLRPPPPSARGMSPMINYTSLMKMLQRASETASMERMAAVAGNLDQAALAMGAPPPGRLVDWDGYMREYAQKINFPAKLLFDERKVKAMDGARAQQAQQQQMMQATLPAVQAAKSLSDTQVGGGRNAIEAMLGTGGGETGQ